MHGAGDEQNERYCECGHPREAHEHYRKGTDCSLCPGNACVRFRPVASVAGDEPERPNGAESILDARPGQGPA